MNSTSSADTEDEDAHAYSSFQTSFDMPRWFTVLGSMSLCIFVLFCAIIFISYKFYGIRKGGKISCRIKAYSVLSLLCFLVAMILSVMYTALAKLPIDAAVFDTEKHRELIMSFWSMHNTVWSFAYLFTYLLMYQRQMAVFRKTIYKVNKWHTLIFFALMAVDVGADHFMSIVWTLFSYSQMSVSEMNALYLGWALFKFFIDLALNLFTLYFFCSNILKLANLNNLSPSAHSAAMLEVMIKYLTLSCFTILSTQLYTASDLLMYAAIEVADESGDFTFYRSTHVVYCLLSVVDAIMSALFVVLSFSFADRAYRACCSCPRAICRRLWMRTTQQHNDVEFTQPLSPKYQTVSSNNADEDGEHALFANVKSSSVELICDEESSPER